MPVTKVQWYQSQDTVTASLLVRELCSGRPASEGGGRVTCHCEERRCSVAVDGEEVWSVRLAGQVIPGQCRISVGRVRAELKLRKAEFGQWTEFTIIDSPTAATADISNDTQPAVAMETTAAAPTKKTFLPEDLLYLNHLAHDFYDTGDGSVKVRVQLPGVEPGRLAVDLQENILEVCFRTTNQQFLQMHDGDPTSTFVWQIHLYDSILPGGSTYTSSHAHLELSLRKATANRWKALEAIARTTAIVASSSSSSKKSDSISCLNPTNQKSQGWDETTNRIAGGALNDLSDPRGLGTDDVMMTSLQKGSKMAADCPPAPPDPTNASVTPHPAEETHTPMDVDPQQKWRHNPHYSAAAAASTTTSTPHAQNCPCCSSGSYQASTTSKHRTFPLTSNSHITPAVMETTNPSYRFEQLRRPSLTGLCNLGNTCFMNSILQCLSNTQHLRDYFVDGHYLTDVNTQNPLGFKGELAKNFSVIIRKLWSGEYDHFSPKKLKNLIASRSSAYEGYQQQDSHEFMSYLLDGLHEDLNRIKHKPQTEMVECESRPDSEVAEESWRLHRLRNDSFFVDNFQGQFKSTLVCPVCNKESVTFDPFLSVSVPLPRKLRLLPVVFVPKNPDSAPRQYVLKLPLDAKLELLKASVARKTGISMTQLRVFEAYGGKFHDLLSSNQQPIASIEENDVIIVSEVLSQREAGGDVVEINVIQRLQFPIFPTRCAECRCEGGEGVRMLRCGKCKAVGYCSRECQTKDWQAHRIVCRGGRPVPVGLPFVVSLPSSRLTYSNLATMAEKFARRSVSVERRTRDAPPASSAQENPESIQESPESIQGNPESIQANTKSVLKKPMYVFTPVDKFGDNKGSTCELEDKGSGELVSAGGRFLAMDWRNNPAHQDCVVVTPKSTMDCDPDPTSSSSSNTPGNSSVTLDQCLELFTQPETLTKEEAWYCPQCKAHREATKQLLLWRLPRCLVVHLKRFSFHNPLFRNKLDKLVHFPLQGLDMSPYMVPVAVNPSPSPSSSSSSSPPPEYDLYGVVNHFGNVYMGHYTACARPPSDMDKHWLYYDDESVRDIAEGRVVSKEAYILFYQQRQCQKTVRQNL